MDGTDQEAQRLFADLLEITSKGAVEAFGHELKKNTHLEGNIAVPVIRIFYENKVLDSEVATVFRNVFKSRHEVELFARQYGKVDIEQFASQASGSLRNVLDILQVIADDHVMVDLLCRAIIVGAQGL